jgi:hypothetical protein
VGLLFFWFLVLEVGGSTTHWVNNASSKDSGGGCYGNLVLLISDLTEIVVFLFLLVIWVECLVAGLVQEGPPPSLVVLCRATCIACCNN